MASNPYQATYDRTKAFIAEASGVAAEIMVDYVYAGDAEDAMVQLRGLEIGIQLAKLSQANEDSLIFNDVKE